MRTIRLKLSEIPKNTINLGFCGENNNTRVLFDCADEIVPGEEYFVYMSIGRPTGEKEGVVLTLSDGMAEWIITSADLTAQFYGEYQITLKHGEDTAKTAIGHYVVNRSVVVNPEPEPPATGLTGRTFMLNEHLNISDPFSVINVVSFDVETPEFLPLFNVVSPSGDEVVFSCLQGFYEPPEPPVDPKLNGRTVVLYLPIGSYSPIPAYINDWQSQELRTITFVSEPKGGEFQGMHFSTTEEALAWLAENAEEIIEGGN